MFKRESITAFSEIRLRISGMRTTEVYEIICRGDEAELSEYRLTYEDHEKRYHLSRRAAVPAGTMIDVLNQCGMLRWDGFSGKNPPGLLDGTMFSLTATVNDGRRISASGSNNFPKHYRDFTDALHRLLSDS